MTSKDDTADVMSVRRRVFVEEQGFSPEIELDGYDKMALYALAHDETNEPVATGRLIIKNDHFTIGRVCVLKDRRGQGYGDFLVRMLLHRALELGADAVYLSSQMPTVGFYRKYGFAPLGDVYQEAGVDHQTMRALRDDILSKCGHCAGDHL